MDSNAILECVRTLIGNIEPYGDSAIDEKRMRNLDKLIYVVDELLYDVEKVAFQRKQPEYSMRRMGENAYKALNLWYSWIDEYLRGEQNEYAQIDCPMNQTECDENCVYYNKLLLKCPLKVEWNRGEQDEKNRG